jgi:hypothetical protein
VLLLLFVPYSQKKPSQKAPSMTVYGIEARMSSELANLFTRHGGTAHSFPAWCEATVAAGAKVAALRDGDFVALRQA